MRVKLHGLGELTTGHPNFGPNHLALVADGGNSYGPDDEMASGRTARQELERWLSVGALRSVEARRACELFLIGAEMRRGRPRGAETREPLCPLRAQIPVALRAELAAEALTRGVPLAEVVRGRLAKK